MKNEVRSHLIVPAICLCVLALFPSEAFCGDQAVSSSYRSEEQVTTLSRPVGVVRIVIESGEQKLVSLPFRAFDSSVTAVLQGQLTGSASEQGADSVLKWDASQPGYVQAVKVDGTGDGEIDGKWFKDLATLEPSDMTLEPGEGFFICNRQGSNQTVLLAGEVVLDASNAILLLPNLNLVAYPYSTAASQGDTSLSSPSDIIIGPGSPDTKGCFQLGKGYWCQKTGKDSLLWMEVRPYEGIFPETDGQPAISAINVLGGKIVELVIACSGLEKLDIYYKDLACTGRFESADGWLPAKYDLDVTGLAECRWQDTGNAQRAPVTEIQARYYLIGNAGHDADGDGRPDCREKFISGSDPFRNELKKKSMDAGARARIGSDIAKGKEVNTNTTFQLPVATIGKIIYVDHVLGSDELSGRTQRVVAPNGLKRAIKAGLQSDGLSGRKQIVIESDGPKRTIRAGLQSVEPTDSLIIQSGHYGENLNIAGRNVHVKLQGHVNLSGRCVRAAPVCIEPVTNAITRSLIQRK